MKPLSPSRFFESLTVKAFEARTPQAVTWELTYGCNLRCVHCYNPTHQASSHELSTGEILLILDQLPPLGVLSLAFSGGEVFTRPDAFTIFEQARCRGLLLDLITNATRITPTIAWRLRDLGIRDVLVSIYGATRETYETVAGRAGSFVQFLQGLESLASAKLSVVVRMPVMTDNVHEVEAAQALVGQHGFKFQYCPELFPRTDGDLAPLRHRLSPQQKVRLTEALPGARSGHKNPEPSCRAGSLIDCACGRTQFAITPYGEMILCTAFPLPKYDLRRGTVQAGWEALKRVVDQAEPSARYECPSCDLSPHCGQKANHAWLEAGDMSVCLPHYKEWAALEMKRHGDPGA